MEILGERNERRLTTDALDAEINRDQEYFFEMTRYTTMNRTLDKAIVEMATQFSRKELDLIMMKKNWVKAYKMMMSKADKVSKRIELRTLETVNAHLEEILNFMTLKVSQDGYRANQIFETLKIDEKTAKRFGFLKPRIAQSPEGEGTGAP